MKNNRSYSTPTRIAIILPVPYRGGSLRATQLLAKALLIGSQQQNDSVEIVLGHLDDPAYDDQSVFADLPSAIKRRSFQWRRMSNEESTRALIYEKRQQTLTKPCYLVPDDGMQQFIDCKVWIIISDRLESPLLPIRPYLLMCYDYIQRYQSIFSNDINQQCLSVAHNAMSVLVTTEFTKKDAIQFAGLMANKVHKVPMLAPNFTAQASQSNTQEAPYFIWTTNLAPHKNHINAFRALQIYYETYEGQWKCKITGVNTDSILNNDRPHLAPLQALYNNSRLLKNNIDILGELSDSLYQSTLQNAQCLWHPTIVDNGTFSVIEAAYLNTPSLSNDYPAMHEIDQQFSLNLSWMNANNPENMASCLKNMELHSTTYRKNLPSKAQLETQSVEKLAHQYWTILREYL